MNILKKKKNVVDLKSMQILLDDIAQNPCGFAYCYLHSLVRLGSGSEARKFLKRYDAKFKKLVLEEKPISNSTPELSGVPEEDQEALLMLAWRYVKVDKPIGFMSAFVLVSAFIGKSKLSNTLAYKE